jgi:enediyne biosynthesis protein E4
MTARLRLLLLALLIALIPLPAAADTWHFTEVAATTGAATTFAYQFGFFGEPDMMAGGGAGGDVDGDGDVDLFVLRGDLGPARLFVNQGDGTFVDQAPAAGLDIVGGIPNGAAFADLDGDGSLDLFVGGVSPDGLSTTPPRLFFNDGHGHFTERTAFSGVTSIRDTWSAAFADYDRDGDLDIALGHWNKVAPGGGHLWRNRGDGHFDDVDVPAGIAPAYAATDKSFTPNFADIDSDGWPDLLMAGDFGTSKVFRNLKNGKFANVTPPSITDENGMGAAVGDYDNDGDLDWFVSSIWDPDGHQDGEFWGITGNRLYRNPGNGIFEDATTVAGVRQGYWGWGSCFADFDNDGDLDLFHVNGMPFIATAQEFFQDPSRLFVANGDGTFTERSVDLGVADKGQGRGVVCADFDRDGDLDLYVTNNNGPTRLFRNDGGNAGHWLDVRLHGAAPNTWAVGARIYATTGSLTQMRELSAGNNFLSSNPIEAHFGLGAAAAVDELRIVWPDGSEEIRHGVAANQRLVLAQGEVPDEFALLLNGDRFRVTAAWRTPQGDTGFGHPVELTGDTGYFWFFDPANVEVVVKVLDGCALNQRYWVFAAGLTSVRVELVATDTASAKSKTYINPQSTAFAPIQDTGTLNVCP